MYVFRVVLLKGFFVSPASKSILNNRFHIKVYLIDGNYWSIDTQLLFQMDPRVLGDDE